MNKITSLSIAGKQADLRNALMGVANSGAYSEGLSLLNLEKEFSKMARGHAAIAVNSRGSALLAAYKFYRSQGHKAVAVQNNTFAAVGAMALEVGMKVYLVDSSPACPAMGIDSLREVLDRTPSIKLVALTHIGGMESQDYPSILELCESRGITLIEDCSSVLGIRDSYFPPGSGSDAAIWSFQQTSILPVGGGSVITTPNLELRNHARLFRSYGKQIANGHLIYGEGQDLRMSEWEAAVALVQLKHLPNVLAARKRDYEALQSIAPPLLNYKTNYQSYMVEPVYANQRHTLPSHYSLSEQLANSLPKKDLVIPNLQHSARWAQGHRCLLIGEGIYDNQTPEEIIITLSKVPIDLRKANLRTNPKPLAKPQAPRIYKSRSLAQQEEDRLREQQDIHLIPDPTFSMFEPRPQEELNTDTNPSSNLSGDVDGYLIQDQKD
jgi:dTDP-4-amino-4,6-dideoxygalactose transaminase